MPLRNSPQNKRSPQSACVRVCPRVSTFVHVCPRLCLPECCVLMRAAAARARARVCISVREHVRSRTRDTLLRSQPVMRTRLFSRRKRGQRPMRVLSVWCRCQGFNSTHMHRVAHSSESNNEQRSDASVFFSFSVGSSEYYVHNRT